MVVGMVPINCNVLDLRVSLLGIVHSWEIECGQLLTRGSPCTKCSGLNWDRSRVPVQIYYYYGFERQLRYMSISLVCFVPGNHCIDCFFLGSHLCFKNIN